MARAEEEYHFKERRLSLENKGRRLKWISGVSRMRDNEEM